MAVNSKQMEPGIESIVNQHFSGRRVELSEFSERNNEEIWRMGTTTDGRIGKVVGCHQSTGMEELLV